MALTLTQAPALMNFVRNPIEVKFTTDNYVTTAGVKYTIALNWSAAPADATNDLVITYNGQTITLISVDPTAMIYDGLHIRFKAGADSTVQWVTNKALLDIKANEKLAGDFDISIDPLDGSKIIFQEKLAGSVTGFSFDEIPGTAVEEDEEAGVAEVRRENFHVMLDIEYTGDTLLQEDYLLLTCECERTPGSDVEFYANIEKKLRPFLSYELPEFDAEIENNLLSAGTFRFRYYEYYGSPAAKQYIYETPWYGLLLGGLHAHDFPQHTYFDDYATLNLFLTNQSRSKNITEDQKEFLAILRMPEITVYNYALEVIIYYDDETNETVHLYDTAFNQTLDGRIIPEILWAETSYTYIVDPSASGTVVSYRVRFVSYDSETEIYTGRSEWFYYTMQASKPQHTRYYLLSNPKGFFDTLRTTGERSEFADVEGTELENYLPADYSIRDGIYSNTITKARQNFVQNSGWLEGPDVSRYLSELMIAEHLYEIVEDEFIPITISRKKLLRHKDNQNLWSIQFEYSYSQNFIANNG
ncbi:MAG: hypothetical protein ACKVPJ_13405 [Chitinophagales bacterium]